MTAYINHPRRKGTHAACVTIGCNRAESHMFCNRVIALLCVVAVKVVNNILLGSEAIVGILHRSGLSLEQIVRAAPRIQVYIQNLPRRVPERDRDPVK